MTATNDSLARGMVEVMVEGPGGIDRELENAVAAVKDAAIRHRTGIMITRTGPGNYVVRAHPSVPFGLIRQRYE